jgi:hypothetical protein
MKPTIGRIVHFTLAEQDAVAINQRREDANAFRRGLGYPNESGERGRSGHVEHVGNHTAAGEVYPAMVVRDFDSPVGTVNLTVHLDGNDAYWATSRILADDPAGEPGRWHWPPRVEHQPGDRPQQF